MNTTHRARPKVPNLPILPPEIWLDILRNATWVPDLLDPESILEFHLASARERKRLYKSSLITKRYVVRVSKQWYQWSAPYLYESIIVKKAKCLKPLRDALVKSSEALSTGKTTDYPLGLLVKRLDLAVRDMSREVTESNNQIQLISDIVQCLPNLIIINFGTWPYHPRSERIFDDCYPTSIIQTLANVCGPNLEAIAWKREVPCPKLEDWYAFLGRTQHLKTMQGPKIPTTERILQLNLASLQSLHLMGDRLMGELTSLRRLIIDVSMHTSVYLPFIKTHGENIEVIQLDIRNGAESAMNDVLFAFSESCPKLYRLEIWVRYWEQLGDWQDIGYPGWMLPKTVRVLGLQRTWERSSKAGYQSLFRGLRRMVYGPALESIQLINEGCVTDIRSQHPAVLAEGINMLKAKGVMLEDHEGIVIT